MGAVRLLIAEHMRVSPDQLLGDRLDDVTECESILLFRHAGVKNDLQQQIAQFLTEIGKIIALDRVGNLIGFLKRVRRNRREVLRQIPRTTGLRGPQRGHDFKKPADIAGRGHSNNPDRVSHNGADPIRR